MTISLRRQIFAALRPYRTILGFALAQVVLIGINFTQRRREADFRHALVLLRVNPAVIRWVMRNDGWKPPGLLMTPLRPPPVHGHGQSGGRA